MPVRHIEIHLICNNLDLSTLGRLGNKLLELQKEFPEITLIKSSNIEHIIKKP